MASREKVLRGGLPHISSGKIRILGDKETENDKLNFRPYVETLVSIVENIEIMPYTIGIFGKWGSGKTSFMKMMKAELDKREEYLTVWFNAWKFNRQEEIWTSLFEAIAMTLQKKRKINSNIRAKLDDLLKRADYIKLMSCIGKSILTRRPDFSEFLDSFGTKRNVESIVEFEKRLSDILKDSKIEKLVIFVDDLDRCLNENVVSILESMKLFLSSEECIFILGIDREKAEKAIERRYENEYNKEDSSEYLRKIIQLPFNIPPLRRRDVLQFIEGLEIDQGLKELVTDVAMALERNPREIKRFLDTLMFRILLMESIEKDENIVLNQSIIVVLSAIEYRFPKFYNEIVNSFDESTGRLTKLDEFEKYISSSDLKEKQKMMRKSNFLKEYGKNTLLVNLLANGRILQENLEPYLFISITTLEWMKNILEE
jgi:predicted KAP-like P-loop ATPase